MINLNKLNESEWVEMFDSLINDIQEPVTIMGTRVYPSDLKTIDYIAYRQELLNFMDEELLNQECEIEEWMNDHKQAEFLNYLKESHPEMFDIVLDDTYFKDKAMSNAEVDSYWTLLRMFNKMKGENK